MDIGKVIGLVVATRKDPKLVGMRLLVVQPLDHNEKPIGDPLVALDPDYAAGYGDLVYMITGGDAMFTALGKRLPVDIGIVGIVDSITLIDEVKEDVERGT
ncbi:EutN/CcmL family microcompartment protein [bacterium]|nr:EutN/CcmL family microcompartment protein [bacterium]